MVVSKLKGKKKESRKKDKKKKLKEKRERNLMDAPNFPSFICTRC